MWIDTQADSEEELHPHGSLSYLYAAFPPGFLGQSFGFAWFTVYIWYITGSSRVCIYLLSLSQNGFYQKGKRVEHPLASLAFDHQGTFLCMCGWGSDFDNKKYVVWAGPRVLP